MATLAYRTRGDSSPQNKERIYFACHPQDFKSYFTPICEDIFQTQNCVIWYDEFLVPGENFNDAIREALEKSELFALVVTPNLVNESNYVMTVEYPAARKAGKPVLPTQMVPTDPAALREHYEGIPAATDGHDAPALSAALLERQGVAAEERKAFSRGLRELTRTHTLIVEDYEELDDAEQDKDTAPMNCMLQLLRNCDGVRIYRL